VLIVMERPSASGSPTKLYKALSSRAQGGSQEVSPLRENPDYDKDQKGDTTPGAQSCPPSPTEVDGLKGDTSPLERECPPSKPSVDAGSDLRETDSLCSRAREEPLERCSEELKTLRDAAWDSWEIEDTPEVQVLDHGEEKRKQAETFFASAQAPDEPVVIDVPVNPPTLERD